LGHRSSLLLEGKEVVASEALGCPEEAQQKLRGQLQGLGIGEGQQQDPCRWMGIDCNRCEVRSIESDQATGHLSSVKEMTKLDRLILRGQVRGNIAELSKLKLWILDLAHTRVVGDLTELSKLKGLEVLDLSQSQVVGNVSALCNLTKLTRLHLSQTQIVGELGEVSKLKELGNLDLSQTRVAGDVGELSKLRKLTDLQLSQTKVHGDITVITSMPYVIKVDLSGTAVSGDLTNVKRGCLNLRELRLGDTQVWISPGAHASHLSKQTIWLPALQSLNVSGCNLNVSFMDMFGALVQNPISSILAAGCSLTGNVHFEAPGSKPLLSSLAAVRSLRKSLECGVCLSCEPAAGC